MKSNLNKMRNQFLFSLARGQVVTACVTVFLWDSICTNKPDLYHSDSNVPPPLFSPPTRLLTRHTLYDITVRINVSNSTRMIGYVSKQSSWNSTYMVSFIKLQGKDTHNYYMSDSLTPSHKFLKFLWVLGTNKSNIYS